MAERGLSSHRRKRRQRRIRRLLGFLSLFLIAYLLITSFLLEVVRVTDNSMAPTLMEGDLLVASPLLHRLERLRRVERADMVLVENPARPSVTLGGQLTRRFIQFFTLGRAQGTAPSGSPFLLRRILGLPGERILLEEYRFYIRSEEGAWVGESRLSSGSYQLLLPETGDAQTPWPSANTPGSPDAPAVTIPPESYYVAADNRGGPMDSRIWGPLGAERLRGPVILRLLPLDRFGPLGKEE